MKNVFRSSLWVLKSSQSRKQPIKSDLNIDFEKVSQDIKIICMNNTYNNFLMKVECIHVRNSLRVSLKIIVLSEKYKHDRDETKIESAFCCQVTDT